MAIKKLLFVDTNIWLDFYRAKNEISLELLEKTEEIAGSIVITHQLETEFKKNRQSVILEGMRSLKAPDQIQRLAIFSDAKSLQVINKSIKDAESRVKKLKIRLAKILANPAANDPVYKACQRIFHKTDDLVLSRENPLRRAIRTTALRRFLHGCPPRKSSDTSMGDALNWEWMIYCAKTKNAELVIVSRDSDYGASWDNVSYVNDHLRQEFAERVSRKRKLLLYTKLSDALKHFSVVVSKQAVEAETHLAQTERDNQSRTTLLVPDMPHDVLRKFWDAQVTTSVGDLGRLWAPKFVEPFKGT